MSATPDDMPHQFVRHIDPDNVTMGQLYSLMMTMRQEQKDTTRELAEVREEFKTYKESQREMLETWSTAKGVLSLLKLLAALGITAAFVAGLFKANT